MKDLTVKEAMKALNVSESTIRRIMKRGELPNMHKEDRKLLIPQSDIDAYLQKQSSSQATPPAKAAAPKPPKPKAVPVKTPPKKAVPKPVIKVSSKPEPKPDPPKPEPKPKPEFKPEPVRPISTIAQPIEELETPGKPPVVEPELVEVEEQDMAPPTTEAVQTYEDREQSLKWIVLQAGILSTDWLEKLFQKMRISLEKYKSRTFPDESDDK